MLLAADFYYLKNIAGRRLVGLRWWNEVNPQTGETRWVFESAPPPNEPGGRLVNATDRRFFWLALYCQPALWIILAISAIIFVFSKFVWLPLVGECTQHYSGDIRGINEMLTLRSHCPGPYDHQHGGLLKMRQIQPGEWTGRKRIVLGFAGEERRRCSVISLHHSFMIRAKVMSVFA